MERQKLLRIVREPLASFFEDDCALVWKACRECRIATKELTKNVKEAHEHMMKRLTLTMELKHKLTLQKIKQQVALASKVYQGLMFTILLRFATHSGKTEGLVSALNQLLTTTKALARCASVPVPVPGLGELAGAVQCLLRVPEKEAAMDLVCDLGAGLYLLAEAADYESSQTWAAARAAWRQMLVIFAQEGRLEDLEDAVMEGAEHCGMENRVLPLEDWVKTLHLQHCLCYDLAGKQWRAEREILGVGEFAVAICKINGVAYDVSVRATLAQAEKMLDDGNLGEASSRFEEIQAASAALLVPWIQAESAKDYEVDLGPQLNKWFKRLWSRFQRDLAARAAEQAKLDKGANILQAVRAAVVECPVCFDEMDQAQPVLLACPLAGVNGPFHAMCKSCWEGMRTRECPICRSDVDDKGFLDPLAYIDCLCKGLSH